MSRLGRVDGVEVSGVPALALALHAAAVIDLDCVALDRRDAIAALVELDVHAGLGVEPATVTRAAAIPGGELCELSDGTHVGGAGANASGRSSVTDSAAVASTRLDMHPCQPLRGRTGCYKPSYVPQTRLSQS